MNQRLGKSEKLKSKKVIEELFTRGRSVKKYPVKLVYLPLSTTEENIPTKSGFSVPKKIVKTAVKRNRIKRLMREAFRKNKYLVAGPGYAFMFIYLSRDEISQDEMNSKIITVLERFKQKEEGYEKAAD
ncbi:ribonuclease P protein component [Salegentibacter chungangensis]|uniref:Ribonuclease P protein component n=1 Tax=Salegentibacter chungangensis TaxID=1335724 RepID=A0ABW3NLT6_9FLAO